MHFATFTTGAAALLGLVSSVMAGSANVVNNCGFTVYYASVAQSNHAGMAPLPAGGMSQSYGAQGVGVSIKLSPNMTGSVTQFEFTPMSGGRIAYDMSNIDGNPFAAMGMTLSPSMEGDSSNPTCQSVHCPAGQPSCDGAYNQPDDVRTLVCSAQSDLTLTLCSGSGGWRRDVHRLHARHLPASHA